MTRPNLVIVRAGDHSLHPRWFDGKGDDRQWDLMVSYFGDNPVKHRDGDWPRMDIKGPKWPALYAQIQKVRRWYSATSTCGYRMMIWTARATTSINCSKSAIARSCNWPSHR